MRIDIIAIGVVVALIGSFMFILGLSHDPTYSSYYGEQNDLDEALTYLGLTAAIIGMIIIIMGIIRTTKKMLPSQSDYKSPYNDLLDMRLDTARNVRDRSPRIVFSVLIVDENRCYYFVAPKDNALMICLRI